jgi:hypothetical protein
MRKRSFIYNVLIILIALSIFSLGLCLIEIIVWNQIRDPFYQKILSVVFILILGLIYILWGIFETKKDSKLEVQRELNFLRTNFKFPLLWGSGIALIFIAGNGLLYEGSDNISFIRSNIFNISGILLGIVSTLILFRSIFQEIAPLVSIEKFLYEATRDLESKRYSRTGRVWLVYPALNIGYYREQIDEVPQRHYSEFTSALSHAKDNPKVDVTVVTYPINLYSKLYKTYIEMNGGDSTDPNIEKCVNEANSIINAFKDKQHSNCNTFEIEPHKFPSHFLIVDNTVYLINTFGMPEYDIENKTFISPEQIENSKEKLAKVYIYKQDDKILADLLIEKFNSQHSNKKNEN